MRVVCYLILGEKGSKYDKVHLVISEVNSTAAPTITYDVI